MRRLSNYILDHAKLILCLVKTPTFKKNLAQLSILFSVQLYVLLLFFFFPFKKLTSIFSTVIINNKNKCRNLYPNFFHSNVNLA